MFASQPAHKSQSRWARKFAGLNAAAALVVLLFGSLLLTGGSLIPADGAAGQQHRMPERGLQFGIYPGGGVGTVKPARKPRHEAPKRRLRSLKKLGAGAPLVVHLYSSYTAKGSSPADDPGLGQEIKAYTRAGLRVELVARYRPAPADAARAVSGFSDYVRALVRRYGENRRFVSLQVTNEANLDGAPEASDGASESVVPALVEAVLAAQREKEKTGATQVKVGFNWAYESSGKSRREFWNSIAGEADAGFADAVDWVGLNSYPGTWSPLFGRSGNRAKRVARTLKVHLKTLRNKLMPRAGLGRSIPIQITEVGWPTGKRRKQATQANFLRSTVRTTVRLRRRLNISGFCWFALRDGRSSDSNFENHYGLMNDRYRPKKAFFAYRKLISRFGR